MSITSIQKQFQGDLELRSVLKFFFFSFIILLVSNLISFNLSIILLLSSVPFSYYISKINNYKYQCTTQAGLLGSMFGFSLAYSIIDYNEKSSFIARYFVFLSTFHFTEYVFTAISNRRSLQPDSFLLNHSIGYWMAASISWIEFLIEIYLIPSIKIELISTIGIIGCLIGEIIRKLAMIHAGVGFTHRLALNKRIDHKLVTNGIYSFLRHPGYSGWFIWAISTQLILCNPICTIIYGYITWNFFSQRIYDEERDLISFFGLNYIEYQNQVWSGVPFVEGYKST